MAGSNDWNPAGRDFWIGKAVAVAIAIFATWFAARVGFAEAARFSQLAECRAARNMLTALRAEVERNVEDVDVARAAFAMPGAVPILEVRTAALDLAKRKPFASVIDPALFSEIERLFAFPLTDVTQTLAERVPGDSERVRFHAICRDVVLRASRVVRPMLEEQGSTLDEAIRLLEEGEG